MGNTNVDGKDTDVVIDILSFFPLSYYFSIWMVFLEKEEVEDNEVHTH